MIMNSPSCKAVYMNNKTFLSDEWKETPLLLALLKCIAPNQLAIATSDFLDDGQLFFYEPNLEMQLILDEYRNFGKGRTIEFCTECGFRMFSTKPTPRNIERKCSKCLNGRSERFREFAKRWVNRPIMKECYSIYNYAKEKHLYKDKRGWQQ